MTFTWEEWVTICDRLTAAVAKIEFVATGLNAGRMVLALGRSMITNTCVTASPGGAGQSVTQV